MENNIDVITSLANYMLNQHQTAQVLAEAVEDDPNHTETYHQLIGAMTAWYYTLQAIDYYINEFMGNEEAQDEQGTGSISSLVGVSNELLQASDGDDA